MTEVNNVFDYLALNPDDKFDFFMETQGDIIFTATYWVDYDTVKKRILDLDSPLLHSMDYLIGKNDEEISVFFNDYPEALTLIPKLLGIRDNKYLRKDILDEKGNPTGKKERVLEVQDIDTTYYLNFEDIDTSKMEYYMRFVFDSKLNELFRDGIQQSIYDYTIGTEAGLNSHGRKNRSGDMGEDLLDKLLKIQANKRGWQHLGQSSAQNIFNTFNMEIPKGLENKVFDGSLYNPMRRKLYLFEINNFSSSGSKMSAIVGQFVGISEALATTNIEFIYITDGRGWKIDQSNLKRAIKNVSKVFNYEMLERGFLDDYLNA